MLTALFTEIASEAKASSRKRMAADVRDKKISRLVSIMKQFNGSDVTILDQFLVSKAIPSTLLREMLRGEKFQGLKHRVPVPVLRKGVCIDMM